MLHAPKSGVFSHNSSLESERESRPAPISPLNIFFYLHLKGLLNETSIFGTSLFTGLCAYCATGLIFPDVSHSIPHLFWVTDNPAFPCKALWENLGSCIPRVDRSLLIPDSARYQMEPDFLLLRWQWTSLRCPEEWLFGECFNTNGELSWVPTTSPPIPKGFFVFLRLFFFFWGLIPIDDNGTWWFRN